MNAVTIETIELAETEASILKRHEKLIRYIAIPFTRRGVDLSDLLQEGRIALLEAARSFRPSVGIRLWTYARRAVFGAMMNLVNREGKHFRCELSVETDEEGTSLDGRFAGAESEASLDDQIWLKAELANLTDMERSILRLHFFEDVDLRAISRGLNVTSCVGVQRIYHSALDKLRERAK